MSQKRSGTEPVDRLPRPNRRIHDENPLRSREKLPEVAACRRCGLGYREGRWTSEPAPAGSHETLCPACERIEGDYPAGVLHVAGEFARAHRDEILGLLHNLEERERSNHPLKRIMAIVDEGSGFCVKTTDSKLVETFGRALQRAYDGELEAPGTTADKENLVRVHWTRED